MLLLRPALSAWMAISSVCLPGSAAAAMRIAAPPAKTAPLGAAGAAAKILAATAAGPAGLALSPSAIDLSGALRPLNAHSAAAYAASAQTRALETLKLHAREEEPLPPLPVPAAPRGLIAESAYNAEASPPGKLRETRAGFLRALSASENPSLLWENASRRRRGVPSAPVAGSDAASARARLPAAYAGNEEIPSAAPSAPARRAERIRIPKQNLRRLILDSLTYYHVTLSSLNWYTFPRFIERWKGMKESIRETEGRERTVSDFMGFFIAHRVLGSTGNYAPMGFRVAANRAVVHDAWLIFDKYFKKDAAAEDAFRRFIQRAKKYNPNRRSTQFRKIIFHALRAGSVLSPADLPAFFDALATPQEAALLAGYQGAPQQRALNAFARVVHEAVLEANREKKPGHRIVGALLLGSFANHAAGPASDLDVQLLSEDGSPFGIKEVMDDIKARWRAEGLSRHPIGGFQYALPLSKNLLMRIHVEPYMIFSPYPNVLKAMRLTPEEETSSPSTVKTLRGFLFVATYSWLLRLVLWSYEALTAPLPRK